MQPESQLLLQHVSYRAQRAWLAKACAAAARYLAPELKAAYLVEAPTLVEFFDALLSRIMTEHEWMRSSLQSMVSVGGFDGVTTTLFGGSDCPALS